MFMGISSFKASVVGTEDPCIVGRLLDCSMHLISGKFVSAVF